jgi:hypothetical protein
MDGKARIHSQKSKVMHVFIVFGIVHVIWIPMRATYME